MASKIEVNVRFGSKTDIVVIEAMSALPPKADINRWRIEVCFVPKADSCTAA
jgi:hypothetical protein